MARQRIAKRLAKGNSPSEARPDLMADQQRNQEADPAGVTSVRIDTATSLAEQAEAVYGAVRRTVE